MGWWSRFQAWLNPDQNHTLYDPTKFVFDTYPKDPPMPEECSDGSADASSQGSAPAAIPSISDDTSDDDVSDGKSDSGDVITETTLEHADDLPSSTFRVFPVAGNHRNSYDSENSVVRAVRARKGERYWRGDGWYYPPTKVYVAETVWRDVTDLYVR